MKKRLGILAMATTIALAIPVAASAADDGEAVPAPPPIDLEDRFDTFEEAVTAVAERMTRALERMTDRYDRAQDWDEAPEALLDRLDAAIDQINENLAAVGDAESFQELSSILDEAREQRRELRGDRRHRCGSAPGIGAGADQTT